MENKCGIRKNGGKTKYVGLHLVDWDPVKIIMACLTHPNYLAGTVFTQKHWLSGLKKTILVHYVEKNSMF